MRTALEIRDAIRAKTLTSEQVVNETLALIDQHDGQVGAFIEVYRDRALEQAREIDKRHAAGEKLGALAGVPVAIKDNIHVKGETTTCGSKFLTNFRAPFSATVTKLLEAEDAIIIGKTNLDEFAMGSSTTHSALQGTSNPWDLERSAGGSSGGSAAAVAARMVPLSLGSDTGGSVRQPASLCGIVGFKPTYGRVSRFGLVAFGSSLDQVSPFASTVSDLALVMEVIGKHCDRDSTSLDLPAGDFIGNLQWELTGTKVGVPWAFLGDLSEESRALFDAQIATLKEQGAEVKEVDLSLLKYSIAVYYILATAEASTNLARFDGVRYGVRSERATTLDEVYDFSKEEGFGPEVKRRILLGTFVLSAGYQDAYYRHAQKVRQKIIEQFKEAFAHCDVIAMPVTPGAAFKKGAKKDPLEEYLEDLYTICANLAGIPAISVPGGFTKAGLPVGLHLLGPQKADAEVCRVAYLFEQATRYGEKAPAMVGETA